MISQRCSTKLPRKLIHVVPVWVDLLNIFYASLIWCTIKIIFKLPVELSGPTFSSYYIMINTIHQNNRDMPTNLHIRLTLSLECLKFENKYVLRNNRKLDKYQITVLMWYTGHKEWICDKDCKTCPKKYFYPMIYTLSIVLSACSTGLSSLGPGCRGCRGCHGTSRFWQLS